MSNIIFFEIKRNLRTSIIWLVSLLLIVGLYAGYYPSIMESTEGFISMMEGFPPEFLAAFGLEDYMSLFTVTGFYGFYGLYVTIAFAICTANLSINIFSYTKTKRIDEYLLVKPLSRGKLFCSRLVAGIIVLLGIWGLYSLGASFIFSDVGGDSIALNDLLAMQIYMLIIVGITFVLGMFASIVMPRIKIAVGVSMPIVFGLYIVDFLVRFIEIDQLADISPFTVFSLSEAATNGIDITNVIIASVVIALIICGCLLIFSKQESR